MPVLGIRGATTASANTPEAIREATRELMSELIRANDLRESDVASIYLTVTPDLDAAFPAAAIRSLGWIDAALLDAQAPAVKNDLARCIRVLIHWNRESNREGNRDPRSIGISHVYLRDAAKLRPDRAAPVTPNGDGQKS
jgi:chorismate mutase